MGTGTMPTCMAPTLASPLRDTGTVDSTVPHTPHAQGEDPSLRQGVKTTGPLIVHLFARVEEVYVC